MQIFKNGKIHSFNSENAIYEAIAVENGRIAALGNTEDVLEEFKKRDDKEVIDLKGKTVVPGFNDSHVHFMNYGYTDARFVHYQKEERGILKDYGGNYLPMVPRHTWEKNFTLWKLDIRKRVESRSFLRGEENA